MTDAEFFVGAPALSVAFQTWNRAMLACFRFEVRVSLLAGRYWPSESVTEDIGHEQKGLLRRLTEKGVFSPEEQDLLRKTNGVRNKLIHCEPDKLYERIRELEPAWSPPARVHQLQLPSEATGQQILSAIVRQANAVPVQKTLSRDEGFFGWMLEAHANGAFAKIEVLVDEATRTVITATNRVPPAGD